MNRFLAWLLPLGVFILSALALPAPEMVPAVKADLSVVVGGACQDCKYDNTGPCVGTTCVAQGNGTWLKKVGTLVTPIWCFNVGAGEAGATSCSDTLPMNCRNESTCTDAACTNCGAAVGKDPRDTKCTLGSYLCKG